MARLGSINLDVSGPDFCCRDAANTCECTGLLAVALETAAPLDMVIL